MIVPVVFSGLALPVGAAAQSGGFYLSGGVGGVLPRDSNVAGSGIDAELGFDPGLSGLLALGTTFGESWRGEAELSYRASDIEAVSGAANGGGDVGGTAFLVNGYYDFKNDSNWTPYVGAGFGLIRLDMGDAAPIGGSRIDDDDVVIAAQGIAGVGYRVNERFSLFTDYRFLAAADPDFATASGAKVESEYSEHRIVVGLRWTFGGAEPSAKPRPAPVKAPPTKVSPPPRKVISPLKRETARAPVPAKAPEVARRYLLFFEWDRSNLTGVARAIVGDAAKASRQVQITVIKATGHADRSGSDRYNMSLSQRRAGAVKSELMRLGIPVDEIFVQWKGESDPSVRTADGAREPRNRRVEILLK